MIEQYIPQQNDGKAKKIRIFLLVSILTALLLGGLFFFLKRKTPLMEGDTIPVQNSIENTQENQGGNTNEDFGKDSPEIDPYTLLYTGDVGGYAILHDDTIRLFDRKKGFVVDLKPGQEKETILHSNPILYTHDAYFVNENTLILRTLDNKNVIKSSLYIIKDSPQESLEPKALLSDNILEIAVSPNNEHIALLIEEQSGSKIDILDVQKNTITTLYRSPLKEWLLSINNDKEVILTAKAASFAESGVYSIYKNTLTMIAQAHTGLTSSISPNHSYIFTTQLVDGWTPQIHTEFRKTPTEETIPLSLYTIGEKCTWDTSENNLYCGQPTGSLIAKTIDSWYLGNINTNDLLTWYNIDTVTLRTIHSKKFIESHVDIIYPQVNKAATHVFFVNKVNGNLWQALIPEKETYENED